MRIDLRNISTRIWLTLGITLIVAALYLLEAPWFHGSPGWWIWPYQTLQAPWRTVLILSAGMIPFFVARAMVSRGRTHAYGLSLLVISMVSLQIGAIGLKDWPFGLGQLVDVVQHRGATTFFSNAQELQKERTSVSEFLRTFPDRMITGEGHNRNKPPGLTLFHYLFLNLNEPSEVSRAEARQSTDPDEATELEMQAVRSAALFSGLMIGLLTALSAPAGYWMMRGFGRSNEACWEAACFIVLSPGLVLIYPQFDQVFALLCCICVGCWARAVRQGDWRWGAAFGVAMAGTLFFTFTVLVIGVLLAGVIVIYRDRLSRIGWTILSGFLAFILTDVFLWLTTGYNALRTFRTALHTQKENLVGLPRPWPQTIPWDLMDFGLTTGWLGFFILASACVRKGKQNENHWLACLVAGQLIITAVSGLLQAEGARLWLFLVPVLAIGLTAETERWTPLERTILHICRGVVVIVVCQKIQFVVLGTEQ